MIKSLCAICVPQAPNSAPKMTENAVLHKDVKVKFVDGRFPRCPLSLMDKVTLSIEGCQCKSKKVYSLTRFYLCPSFHKDVPPTVVTFTVTVVLYFDTYLKI